MHLMSLISRASATLCEEEVCVKDLQHSFSVSLGGALTDFDYVRPLNANRMLAIVHELNAKGKAITSSESGDESGGVLPDCRGLQRVFRIHQNSVHGPWIGLHRLISSSRGPSEPMFARHRTKCLPTLLIAHVRKPHQPYIRLTSTSPSEHTMTTRDTTALSDINKIKPEADGSFKRVASVFRSFIEKGGEFAPEKDRYHLYVSYACPWATRSLIARKLKGLEDIIPVTVVSPRLGSHGWPFGNVDEFPGAEADPLFNSSYVKDLYLRADPEYASRFTVPVLWDKKLSTVVNNESAEIIRMFNTAFNELLPADKAALDLYPEAHRAEIDALNEWIYSDINNGVYLAGFATTQSAYESAVTKVFAALDKIEAILTGKDYLVGNTLTEADVRLFPTIIRFDVAYVGQFKCNIRTIRGGYPAIHAWLRNLYWNLPAFKDPTHFDHIKACYYGQQPNINPTRIIPVGPIPNVMPL